MLRGRCRSYSPAHVAIHPIAVLLSAGLLTDATDSLAPWREPCAQHVGDAMVARFGGAAAHPAGPARHNGREQVLQLLDYLASSHALGTPEPFVQVVLWLRDVSGDLGAPAARLDFSLDRIATFLGHNVPGEHGDALRAILASARNALADACSAAPYGMQRLAPLAQAPDYLVALMYGDHRAALRCVCDAMDQGASLAQVYVQIVQPALYEVGNQWQKNRLSVSQEHLVTATSQDVMALACLQARFAPRLGRSALFACVQGNQHGLGVRMVSDAFETRGWDATCLGTDIPAADLLREVGQRRPDLLGLSAALPQHLITARQTIEMLRAELGADCPEIWIGGLATLSAMRIWRHTRADRWASDALHALEQV